MDTTTQQEGAAVVAPDYLAEPGTEIIAWGQGSCPGVYQVRIGAERSRSELSGLRRQICEIDGAELISRAEREEMGDSVEDDDEFETLAEYLAEERGQDLARRIAAALTACKGISTEELEDGAVRRFASFIAWASPLAERAFAEETERRSFASLLGVAKSVLQAAYGMPTDGQEAPR